MNPARIRIRRLPHSLTAPRITRSYHLSPPLQIRLQSSESLPKIAQTSFWTSLVPKFLRNRPSQKDTNQLKSKEWNPASFYIVIFILIGSQAIRMLALKHDFDSYSRSTDAKIALLREVIERVKNGEKVDVEKMLGTGNEVKEREWEEVLRELEEEDSLWHEKAANAKPARQPQQDQKPEEQREKDPVVPAEGSTDHITAESSGATRKSNFF